MNRALPFLLVVLVATLFAAGATIRGHLDLDASLGSLESVRAWVLGLGWRGPLLFVGLVTFRNFLLLPSGVLLVLGGLAWGGVEGMLLGWAGIVLSALMKFGIARGVAGDWLRARLRRGAGEAVVGARRIGPWVIALVTAYPGSPMSPFHWAGGLTTMSVGAFAAAVILAGPLRAGAYAFVGQAALDWGLRGLLLAGGGLLLVASVPLAFARVRRRLFGAVHAGD